MSNAIISFLFSAGASAWFYAKFMRTTGNNTKTAVIATGAVFLIIFLVFFSVLSLIHK